MWTWLLEGMERSWSFEFEEDLFIDLNTWASLNSALSLTRPIYITALWYGGHFILLTPLKSPPTMSKPTLYTFEQSVWSQVPRLALVELGYPDDAITEKSINLSKSPWQVDSEMLWLTNPSHSRRRTLEPRVCQDSTLALVPLARLFLILIECRIQRRRSRP